MMMTVSLKDYVKDLDDEVASIVAGIAGLTDTIFTELPHRRGKAGTENIYGEEQKALDVWSNDVIVDELKKNPAVKAVISEELGEPWINPEGNGSYTVTLDPLDGSSNIESNNLFGTIVGVHKEKDLLAKGEKQVCAFYNLYGPITTLVLADGKRVNEFVKHRRDSTDYFMGKEDLKLPEPGKLMGLGGAPHKWTPAVKKFFDYMVSQKMKVRYGGSFVGDINQILFYGGAFMYPELVDKPQGKLRLVIECNPMSYIVSAAGGVGINGRGSVLEIQPKEYDERTPIYIGNKDLVAKLEEYIKE